METSQFAQRARWGTAGVVVAVLSACGGDDGGPSGPQAVTAQQACDALSGKTIAGATLTTVAVAASGAAPTYCKATGTIAPKLNFELRLPQTWNGKLYYGGGGGYNGAIPGLTGTNLTAADRATPRSAATRATRATASAPTSRSTTPTRRSCSAACRCRP